MRFEFRPQDASFEVTFSDGGKVRAIWPADADQSPFFYLLSATGAALETPTAVMQVFPTVGIIPGLAPIEPREQVLREKYVKENLYSHLAPRHFRNQLLLLESEGQYEKYKEFCSLWLPEIELLDPDPQHFSGGSNVNVFYREGAGDKELSWAGDGIQVFLQLLLHVFRLRDSETLVIDEPEVFLHADLQRRLLRLLDDLGAQVILATHSSEIAIDSDPQSLVFIDKSRTRGVRPDTDQALSLFSESIGSNFNLRLARALKTKVVLFVEGQDMKLLGTLASTIGASKLATETGVAVIPLNGVSKRSYLRSFEWLAEEFLAGAVAGFVILDRDYHSEAGAKHLEAGVESMGLRCHVWKRKEIESYLLLSRPISAISGADETLIESLLLEATDATKDQVLSQIVPTRQAEGHDLETQHLHLATIIEKCQDEIAEAWQSLEGRLRLAPPKDVRSVLNGRLQAEGYKSFGFRGVATSAQITDLDEEFCQVLLSIEELIVTS